ncbi:MAG: putative DNA-binding domain-containing protein [Pseudomonadota bacterium]
MRLHELQRAMRTSILEGADEPIAAMVDGLGLTPAQRLRIYRNNSVIGLTEALEATFPVVCRLVGKRFFGGAAEVFIKTHPPSEPRLSAYGASFGGFLAAYPPAAALIYLPDVARLEWAVNAARHAPDAPCLSAADLAALSAERQTAFAPRLHPASRLIVSSWPIERIWRANQPDADPDSRIDLGEGGCRLLVYRCGFEAAIAALSPGEHALLSAFAEGLDLERAYERAVTVEPLFDLATTLAMQLTRGSLLAPRQTSSIGEPNR